jgi:hypothetical protein
VEAYRNQKICCEDACAVDDHRGAKRGLKVGAVEGEGFHIYYRSRNKAITDEE